MPARAKKPKDPRSPEAQKMADEFAAQLKRLTQDSYLLMHSVVTTKTADPAQVSTSLSDTLSSVCRSGRRVAEPHKSLILPDQVSDIRERLPCSLSRLLIVRLDSMMHEVLSRKSRRAKDLRFEHDLAWAKSEWWYREVILLAEVRNHIVHGDGLSEDRSKRLKKAGWSPEEIEQQSARFTNTSYSDFLDFKKVVRTALNRVADTDVATIALKPPTTKRKKKSSTKRKTRKS
jgi:hypothetical protein